MSRYDVDRAELTHRPGVAQDDAVDQTPLDVRYGDLPEHLPSVRAETDCGKLLFDANCFHHGNQLARNEGKRDERGREDESRCREDDFQTRVLRPHLEIDLRSERDDEHERATDERAEPRMLPPATALDR